MAIEIYKHEIGTQLGFYRTQQTFYWEVANESGRNQDQISGDIATSLEGAFGWFFSLREFWAAGNNCTLYRIRRVWPTFAPWNDYYWRYRHFGGRLLTPSATLVIKARVAWWTGSADIFNACTYFSMWPQDAFYNNELQGQWLLGLEIWAAQHDTQHVTAFGDKFRPCILDRWGGYNTILGHWVDPRPVASRAHRWKG